MYENISSEKKEKYGETLNEEIITIIEYKNKLIDYLDRPAISFTGENVNDSIYNYIVAPEIAMAVKEVIIKSPLLDKMPNAVIYDVPGFNSPTARHMQQTKERMYKADAIIMVATADKPSITSEQLKAFRDSDNDGTALADKLFIFENRSDEATLQENIPLIFYEWGEKYKILYDHNRFFFGSANARLQQIDKLPVEEKKKNKDYVSPMMESISILDDSLSDVKEKSSAEKGFGIVSLREALEEYNQNEQIKVLQGRVGRLQSRLKEVLAPLTLTSNSDEEPISVDGALFAKFMRNFKENLRKSLNDFRDESKQSFLKDKPLSEELTIDLNNKALRAISQNIESIEKLINAEEDQIQRIKSVIDEYTNSVKDKLTDVVFRSELRAESAKHGSANAGANENEFSSLKLYFDKLKTDSLSFDDIKKFTHDKITGKFKSDSNVYGEIFKEIEKNTYDYFISELDEYKNKKKQLTGHKLDSILDECMSDSILFRTINNYITGKVNETLEENQDIIIQLNSDISKLLNQRLAQIEKSSDKCRCDLEKLDVPLELPELPDFDFEMPEISMCPKIDYEKVNFHIDTNSLKGLIHREKNKFFNFLRALFGWNLGQQIYFYDEELSFDRYHHEFDKQYHSIEASLKDGEVFKALCSENANMADELVKTIDRISDHLSDILELLKSSISKFSNLIDDTRKHKENIDYHNAKKMLINDLMNATADFSDCWNVVLDKIDSSKEMV